MTTTKIEVESDKLLLFGGVYSNLQALEKMKALAEENGFSPKEVICNGDIVGYCAQPEESLQLVKEWGIHAIIGNVEEQLREGADDCGCDFESGTRCDVFSRQWYPYAQAKVGKEMINWLNTLPYHLTFNFFGRSVTVVHGAYSHISRYVFKSTDWKEKIKEFEDSDSDIIIAGHSGLPFSEKKEDKIWINPGVIGMPANDGSTSAWYAILKWEGNAVNVEHHSFTYNNGKANQLMLENNLPQEYANTLLTGIWDNCEILPPRETELQGKAITF